MEKVRKIIGLTPEEAQAIETRLVKEITQISQYTHTQYLTTFVLEHDKGDHQFPVLAQVSNMGNTLWLNTALLQNQPKPVNIEELKGRCQKAFNVSKIQVEIDKILCKAFPLTDGDRLKVNQELTKLFLKI